MVGDHGTNRIKSDSRGPMPPEQQASGRLCSLIVYRGPVGGVLPGLLVFRKSQGWESEFSTSQGIFLGVHMMGSSINEQVQPDLQVGT
jgi:hypothetical protein